MKRRLVYRVTEIACRVLLIALLLSNLVYLVWGWGNSALSWCILAVGLVSAAANAFSIACPFCNRPLPGKAFKQPGKHTCEFCGKEIDIV